MEICFFIYISNAQYLSPVARVTSPSGTFPTVPNSGLIFVRRWRCCRRIHVVYIYIYIYEFEEKKRCNYQSDKIIDQLM